MKQYSIIEAYLIGRGVDFVKTAYDHERRQRISVPAAHLTIDVRAGNYFNMFYNGGGKQHIRTQMDVVKELEAIRDEN